MTQGCTPGVQDKKSRSEIDYNMEPSSPQCGQRCFGHTINFIIVNIIFLLKSQPSLCPILLNL